jgi:hypothetical protein
MITVTQDQVDLIHDLVTINAEKTGELICDFNNFALNKCVIRVCDPEYDKRKIIPIFYEKIDDNRLRVKCEFGEVYTEEMPTMIDVIQKYELNPETGNMESRFVFDKDAYPISKDDEVFWSDKVASGDPDNNVFTNFQIILHTIFLINTFLLYYKDVGIEDLEDKNIVCSGDYAGASSFRHNKNIVRKFKRYQIRTDWKPPVHHGPHIITCNAWGVAGHTRRYKSGKVIMVKPYIKGKNRDSYVGKLYKLFPS